jgi:hypothetical protein
MRTIFWLKTLKGRKHADDWMLGNWMGRCGLDASGSGYDLLWALVNMVMNLRVP